MIKAQVFRGNGSAKNQWRWRLVAKNGKKIASSGEAFYNKAGAQRALKKVTVDVVDLVTMAEIRGKMEIEVVDLKKKKSKRKAKP